MARRIKTKHTMIRRPQRPIRKKQARRKTVLAFYVLLTLFVAVTAVLVVRLADYREARQEYAAYQSMDSDGAAAEVAEQAQAAPPEATAEAAVQAPPAAAPTPKPFHSPRVDALRKENRDTVGWLDIIGTGMQYPVVQAADNEYYMARTFQKKRNVSGAIFMDCWNAPGFTDFNTVIYGHNMQDGSMFAGLREYRNQKYLDDHSTIEITLLNKKLRYQVFAAYISQGESDADFRGQGCVTEEQWAAFIRAARRRSTAVHSAVTVSRHDRLLTLVTCTSGTNPWFWVVHAVLAEEQI